MIDGDIVSVVSSDAGKASAIAEKLGKKHESDGMAIYYRKKDDHIRSTLVSIPPYPERIIMTAEALTISSQFIFALNSTLSWSDGELGLLLESSGIRGTVISGSPDVFRETFGSLAIGNMAVKDDMTELEGIPQHEDRGYVYLDRVFSVRGVGTVALGFSLTDVDVHERFTALPSGKEVEVKSIQVLDEDQEGVGRGVRVGLALKNAELNELKDTYALVRPEVKTTRSLSGTVKLMPWGQMDEGKLHIVSGGISAACTIKRGVADKAGEYSVELNRDVPLFESYILLNLNVRPGKSRVVGTLKIK